MNQVIFVNRLSIDYEFEMITLDGKDVHKRGVESCRP